MALQATVTSLSSVFKNAALFANALGFANEVQAHLYLHHILSLHSKEAQVIHQGFFQVRGETWDFPQQGLTPARGGEMSGMLTLINGVC